MKRDLRRAFDDRLKYYRSQHKTVGCKITHMVGVPMIAMSFPIALFNRRLAAQFQAIGWLLQLTGHFVFEHNKPVFVDASDPLTAAAALVFVADEWDHALSTEAKRIPLVPFETMPDSSLN